MHSIIILTIISIVSVNVISSQLFSFPHGYFDSKKLQPYDAIYLSMMAQSNLEYGGISEKDLDTLDQIRKVVERPTNLTRNRVEDDERLDREITNKKKDEEKMVENAPKSPFNKLNRYNRRDDPMEENPFEEIATRSPPRTNQIFKNIRRRIHHKNKKERSENNRRNNKRKHGKEDREKEKEKERRKKLEDEIRKRRKIISDTERKNKHEEDDFVDLTRGITTSRPTLVPSIHRLLNNPFSLIDISHPTVLNLPIPPIDSE